jgi:hypothetical protein
VDCLDESYTKYFVEGGAAHQYHEALSLADNKTTVMFLKGCERFWAFTHFWLSLGSRLI